MGALVVAGGHTSVVDLTDFAAGSKHVRIRDPEPEFRFVHADPVSLAALEAPGTRLACGPAEAGKNDLPSFR